MGHPQVRSVGHPPVAYEHLVRNVLGIIGMIKFWIPAAFYTARNPWSYRLKMGALTVVGLVGLASSHLLDRGTWASSWAGILEAMVVIVPMLLALAAHRRHRADFPPR